MGRLKGGGGISGRESIEFLLKTIFTVNECLSSVLNKRDNGMCDDNEAFCEALCNNTVIRKFKFQIWWSMVFGLRRKLYKGSVRNSNVSRSIPKYFRK